MDLIELKKYFMRDLNWGWKIPAQITFQFLIDIAKAAEGKVILDAGAGYQRYKPFFERSLYLAQEHPVAGIQNKGITKYDILADVKCIPLKESSIDYIISTSSLEHIEFPEIFFLEAYRVLKPGGGLFISVPFAYPEHEVPYDFQRPTQYGLRRWYKNGGFENIEISKASSSIYTSTVFIKEAVYEGHAGFRNAIKGNLSELFRLFPRYFVYYFLVKPSIALLYKLLDKFPDNETLFPIGWCAQGYKPGTTQVALSSLDKEAFLLKNKIENDDYIYVNGTIQHQ